MQGQVCLVTGATAGIGLVTARELARKGAHVFLVGRSRERCSRAAEAIRAAAGTPSVEWLVADLSSQADVRRLAEEVRSRTPRLDVLVNNAGGIFLKRQESAEGIEMTFALNHLSYFLLTNLLRPLLEQSAPARVVSVASDAHKGVSIPFDDVEGKKRFGGWRAYQQSKLANILFTDELARRLLGKRVTANALHPGFVRTSIVRQGGVIGWMLRRAADVLAVSPDEGAKTSIYLASSPDVAQVTGRYFVKERPVESSPQSRDACAALRLWQLSAEMTGLESDE
jgi:NAD(P)-dependent dehydrogenase (short-subunit alcohol dehydrogenase family)